MTCCIRREEFLLTMNTAFVANLGPSFNRNFTPYVEKYSLSCGIC